MRDLFFFPIFFYCLMHVFKRPVIGVAMWVWTALLAPNYLLWGFASPIRYNFVISIVTLFAIFINKPQFSRLNNRVFYAALLFLLWTMVSSMTAIGDLDYVSIEQEKFVKVFVLFMATMMVVVESRHIILVMSSFLLGLGYYAVSEGAKVIASAGSHRVWGPGSSIIGDNNHFALALLVTLPFTIFLIRNAKFHKYCKWFLQGVLLLFIAAVFGTYSRGGLIGLVAFSIFYAVLFKKKTLLATIAIIISLTFASFVPKQWADRMDTIKSADQDNSFMGRVIAWKISTLVALDHPLTGGGFQVIHAFPIWMSYGYGPNFKKLDFIPTGNPDPERSHAAHSIYFQVLGEHGFIGLGLFGLLALFAVRNTLYARKQSKSLTKDQRWHKELAECLMISLLVYFVVGAALNMAYFDGLYILFALTQIHRSLINRSLNAQEQ